MIKPKYKQIASLIGKSTPTIKGYKINNPELLELLKLGSLCKLNQISEKDIELILNLKTILDSQVIKEELTTSENILKKVNSILTK